ncbi:MAG TPA: hypothetical protein EYP62_08865, partial [Kiritimatiellae bacterium]|nr:hypothetical protein [Kiritimatiellia bacterium]
VSFAAVGVWLAQGAAAADYFVNDASTNGDVYTTAPGSFTNHGQTAAQPKDSLQAIIDDYDLGPGDTVYVDTGNYSLSAPLSLGGADSGSAANPLTIVGSTNFGAGGTVFDRGQAFADSYTADVFQISWVTNLDLRNITFRSGHYGLYFYRAVGPRLERVTVVSNTAGVAAYASRTGRMDRCTAAWNSRGCLFSIAGADSAFAVERSVFWSNSEAIQFGSGAWISLSNSVVVGGTVFPGAVADAGDFDVFYDAALGGGYHYLSELQDDLGDFHRSTCTDPAFASATNLDFHPRSVTGRFDPESGNWVTDTVHSVLIDFGDPGSSWSNEPPPNGSRMNIGIHGDTAEASKSRTNAWVFALSFNDGGTIAGTGGLYWIAGGFSNGATVRLEYSPDAGESWTTIVSSVAATNGEYEWDTTAFESSPRALWKITSEGDTNVYDVNDHIFVVRNTNFTFYVNDADTNGDVYCTAPGDSTNTGLSASQPLDSLQAVLDTYDLAGGDIVYLDTGYYALDEGITWGSEDGADASNPIVLAGSTNGTAGGSVLDRGLPYSGSWTADVLYVSDADYLLIRDLTLASGRYGLNCHRADGLLLERVQVVSNSTGISGYNCSSNRVLSCLLAYNTTGLAPGYGGGWGEWDLDRCVFWSNTTALSILSIDHVTLSNSAVVGGTVLSGEPPDSGDHSTFWSVAFGGGYDNLAELQKDRDGWWYCTYADPAFADPEQMDFHPQSLVGRYDPGTGLWTTDGVHSVLIDFGDPEAAFANEPSPNGSRLNAGLYGNTAEASKSRTNSWLLALSYNDGGTLSVPSDRVYWKYGNIPTTATVRIEFSGNSGVDWDVVATNIAVAQGYYVWANTNYTSSRFARWRVVLETDTNTWDANDSDFTFRNGPFIYYVNDTNLVGDVYTTAPGDDGNLGSTPGSPKATLQGILDTHDLEPGDKVYVDTGVYALNATPTVTSPDAGDSNQYVYIVGSTNEADGGSVFNRQSSSSSAYGLYLNGAPYVQVENLTFRNGGSGIYAYNSDGIRLVNVRCRDNYFHGIYIRNSSAVTLERCALYDNARDGVRWESSSAGAMEHCVIHGNDRSGLRVLSGWVSLSNSAVVAEGRDAQCYHLPSTTNVVGDYNALFATGQAVVAFVAAGGTNYDRLAAWVTASGNDIHSLEAAPLFADAAAGDFHLQSAAGRWVADGTWTNDAVTSPLIDAGDPSQDASGEPGPNGARLNIGLYGGTSQASKSRTNGWLAVGYPARGGWLSGTGRLHWIAGGAATGHVVRVEVSTDGGETWSTVTSAVAATVEVLTWDTTVTNDSPAGLWRVTSTNDATLSVTNTAFFAVRNAALQIFVNDTSTDGDTYCSAPGAATNWIATQGRPLDSLWRALEVFDLEPGDTVYVDAGLYQPATNVFLGRVDSGSSNEVVCVLGTTSDTARTIIDRVYTGSGGYVLELDGARWVAVSNLYLCSGYAGLRAQYSHGWNAGMVFSVSNAADGFSLYYCTNAQLQACVARRNGGRGLSSWYSSGVTLRNGVLWSNTQGAVYQQSGSLTIKGSVMTVTGSGKYLYDVSSAAGVIADYNDLLVEEGARAAKIGSTTYTTVSRWQQVTSNDLHSLTHPPWFADPAGDDYHPYSEAGRYLAGGIWTNDSQTSYLVDTGDPAEDYSAEPVPNGARVNIGLYGNSPQASKSRTNAWLLALTLSDGGVTRGTNDLYWVAGGAATGHTVRLEFSRDGGATWTNIITSNLNASAGVYTWNTVPFGSTPLARWRVVSETDTNVFDETDQNFVLNNGALTYYVNDSSTNGDVYTTAPGDSLNDGLAPETPKDSLAAIIDAYALQPGDLILIDTGTYTLTNEVVFGETDAGVATNMIDVRGSTNYAAGGTVFNGQNISRAIDLNNTEGIHLSHLAVTGVTTGVRVYYSDDCRAEWLRVFAPATGFELVNASQCILEHCLVAGASSRGVYNSGSSGTRVNYAVITATGNGFHLSSGSIAVSNSIIKVSGTNRYAYYINSGSVTADYNNIVLSNGAYAAYRSGNPLASIYQSVSRWARDTGNDAHTLTQDPLFADEAGGDYHLRSQAGRYAVGSGWVTDAVTSPLLDAGDPSADYAAETSPNGARVNIGLYGGSAEASRTPTNAALTVISLNDGGRAEGEAWPLYWVARGAATGHTVKLDFSADGGVTWTGIATGVAAANGMYEWNTTNFETTLRGRWRVTSEDDGSVADTNDTLFALRNEPIYFYVNDSVTTGDVFCTAAGGAGNDGLGPGTPLDSLQALLDAYDVEPGDVIYVDAGTYSPSGTVTIGYLDAGEVTNRVVIQGSTSDVAATVFEGTGFRIDSAPGIQLGDIRISGADTAVKVYLSDACVLEWVSALDGTYGFEINNSDDVILRHCVAAGNSARGIYNVNASHTWWQQGVLWKNNNGGYLAGGDLSIQESVIGAYGGGNYAYYIESGVLTSDYNCVYVTAGAYVGGYKSGDRTIAYDSVSRWRRDRGHDIHSLSEDPGLVDPDGRDFHARSAAGRYLPGTGWTNDPDTSVLLDSADPASSYADEPAPNGARRNIGLYGDTGQASKTPTNAWLALITLNDGGRIEGTNYIYWVAGGDATGHTVRIRFSADAGNTWTTLTSGVSAATGAYLWDTTLQPSTIQGSLRVESETDTNVWDQTDSLFAVRNSPLYFYVNDSSTNGDVYTTAAGSSTNDGLSAASPKDSLADIFLYDLEPGDAVYVDTGEYDLNSDLVIGQFDAGEATNRLVIQGSTNAVGGGTVIDRESGSYAMSLNQAGGLALRNLTLLNDQTVLRLYRSDDCLLQWVTLAGGNRCLEINDSDNCRIEHAVLRNCGGEGIYTYSSWNGGAENLVLWSNRYGVKISGGSFGISNSVIGAFGAGSYAFHYHSGTLRSDYNDVYLQNGAYAGYRYLSPIPEIFQTLARWQRDFGQDLHSLAVDPQFADLGSGDYHLRSTAGRYVPGIGWTNDPQSSPLIDAGDPLADWAQEPEPDGGRINIGLYGNSPEASRTPTNGWLTVITLNDGGRFEGTNWLYWAAGGDATGHLVKLEFSADGGVTWTDIASDIASSDQAYLWDSVPYGTTMQGLWRITDQSDTNVWDQTDFLFALRNAPVSFYVNNGSTAGDVYCSIPGGATNSGLSPSSPKLDLQDLLDTWDIEPGDTIYVDTGEYTLTSPITIDQFDAGDATNRVTIQGSTNSAAGGTVFVKHGGGSGLNLDQAVRIALRHFTVRNADNGLRLYLSDDCLAEWVRCEDGVNGFFVEQSDRFQAAHCVAAGNSAKGIYAKNSDEVVWRSGVLWSNRYGGTVEGSDLEVSHTVIGCWGSVAFAHWKDNSSSLTSDYNAIHLGNGAFAAAVLGGVGGGGTTRYASVSAWSLDSGQDLHTLAVDPLFADAAGYDFHLKSSAGRYLPGTGWVTDSVSSVLIDSGAPAAVWTNEPSPNGQRINIGLYGNTAEASLTPTNGWLQIITLNDGGWVSGTVTVRWVAGGAATGHTVTLRFSSDAGETWSNIVSGVPAADESYQWNTIPFGTTALGLWDITSDSDTNITDTSDQLFYLRNGGSLPYYVNDSSTNGDVYCTAPGASTNLGLRPMEPKASIQEIIDTYDLEAGDIIYVDTGEYDLNSDILIGDLDAGDQTNRVVFQGSTNYAAGGTVLDRQVAGEDIYGIHLYQTVGIELKDLTIKNAGVGVYVDDSPYVRLVRVRAEDNSSSGFALYDVSGTIFSNCISFNNQTNGLSLPEKAYDVQWRQGVIWGNPTAVSLGQGCSASIYNSVLQASGYGHRIYSMGISATVDADYNDLVRTNDAYVAEQARVLGGSEVYATLTDWSRRYGEDLHSLSHDPLFAESQNGDFHPKSVLGRFVPGAGWTNDAVHSPLIDTGDPSLSYTNEPAPNGSRINIGLYGDTPEASRSRTNSWLLAVSINDGGTIDGTNWLFWVAGGELATGTVQLLYSGNNGIDWDLIASNLDASAGAYQWDVSSEPTTVEGLWRVVYEDDPAVYDTVDENFAVRNQALTYYVNDTNTAGDVYCSAPGSSTNSGLSADQPLDSPLAVLERYPVVAGDVMYIDTGEYVLTNELLINELHRGEASAPIRIIGSTNYAAGGTVLDRADTNTSSYVVRLVNTRYVEVEHLTLKGAGTGIAIGNSQACTLRWVRVTGNMGVGFSLSKADPVLLERCVAWSN